MKTYWCAGALLVAFSASAHEFWILPDRFVPPAKTPVSLSLLVGENFVGEVAPFGLPLVASLRLHTSAGMQDLRAVVPAEVSQARVPMAFAQTGTHLLSLDTHPSTIELAPDKFTAYLREEGLERVIARREALGQTATPGRERFRRHVKTLLSVGGASDASYGTRTGQILELLPLANPQTRLADGVLPMKLMFNGEPLQGALVKAWHQGERQLTVLRARTDARGRITYRLPWSGVWMVSVVHMVPVTGEPGVDWDSHWGNLTFELPPKALAR
jgi:uncharacterized GH25 family protein